VPTILNFVGRPRGVVIAEMVNGGFIRGQQIVEIDKLHLASTRAFTCGPLIGDEIQWLNVIFNDEADAYYVQNHGILAEFGWVSSIEKVLP
jgi:hypothetical protein